MLPELAVLAQVEFMEQSESATQDSFNEMTFAIEFEMTEQSVVK